jgi:hypothetical protein
MIPGRVAARVSEMRIKPIWNMVKKYETTASFIAGTSCLLKKREATHCLLLVSDDNPTRREVPTLFSIVLSFGQLI